tara:strand:- start:99 stop:293 length:195 start_codon:yes stop_codon:yes gene_type:complete
MKKQNYPKKLYKEEWINVQEQKILLHECKQFVIDYVMQELENDNELKQKLAEQSRKLLSKLKNF